jgi:phosphoribosylformylglycinamidine (FGAM) synthase-like enzyme
MVARTAIFVQYLVVSYLIYLHLIVSDCRDAMIELECACDGGKDSLSMAAAAGGETVMAPGNLVVSAYVGCPDITKVVTPDLKMAAAGGVLLHVDLASVPGARRLGGSALAQAYSQVGACHMSLLRTWEGCLLYVALPGARRLGGSALAQAYSQVNSGVRRVLVLDCIACHGCYCVCYACHCTYLLAVSFEIQFMHQLLTMTATM